MDFEPLDQLLQRKKKLQEIQSLGYDGYPHEFRWKATVPELLERYGETAKDELGAQRIETRVPGRIVTLRLHGKAGFAHIQGGGKRIQIYVKLDVVGEKTFRLFQLLDIGDSIGVAGHVFRTKTNELTIWVEELTLLAKALLPLPEKWHGLADVERRYRQRYLDLIANEKAREVFIKRAQIVGELRGFFDGRGYIEVETPMMQPLPGGATARPFITHHNALDVDLYLRIAPELYLKRLIVGGLDRVYEINRNFRNEGISTQHNPEFTMLEFYEAYSNYRDLMDLTEEVLSGLAKKVAGSTIIHYGEQEIDFARWQRLSMHEAITKYWPSEAGTAPSVDELKEPGGPRTAAARHNTWAASRGHAAIANETGAGKLTDGDVTGLLFEAVAEEKLIQPTILYDFPIEISPLSKQKPAEPALVERFEVFAGGMEIGNAFSELNDPVEQERRFRQQIEQGGDEVPKQLDIDYIRALTHGMPPAAGMGIGIDRLTMLFTDSHSIREVILFPLLRPEMLRPEAGAEGHADNSVETK